MDSSRGRVRARLHTEAPILDDVDVARPQETASKDIQKSKVLSDKAVSFEWEAIARNAFGHVARKKAKKTHSRLGRNNSVKSQCG